ncbi:Vik1p NDAI_0F01180 [Naumovozyma dairenensis CBS 421]|uniref:Spindle pole body-associated protein Vik1/Cik1 microtubule binding domain-containing protein n=1 Tax=Naumovozyma dairenensis (strain ATCC 10597 / BCRC 20456 / CBS 421 / NBRC 0211 / NRRL Y-12639) TaxID=1071378 RepID=G0WCC6_NAUDC|nr:hypothetical protein NDAI_0F01180 [Naumovozyma dairenensis CBS 421]CCD25437.1 hypothetical protein NDAI_0F01180 [Naumovozyma dairenensis CBS 421]
MNNLLHDITDTENNSNSNSNSNSNNKTRKKRKLTQDEINKPILANYKKLATQRKIQRQLINKVKIYHEKNLNCNWEILKLKTKILPDLKYQISKRKGMKTKILNDISNLNDSLLSRDQIITDLTSMEPSIISQLQSQFQQEISNLKKIHDEKFNTRSMVLQLELNQLEKMKPKEELLKEIAHLDEKLIQLQDQIIGLTMENENKCNQYNSTLQKNFNKFKLENNSIDDIMVKQRNLTAQKSTLLNHESKLLNEIQLNETEINQYKLQIMVIEDDLKRINEKSKPLKDSLNNKLSYLHELQTQIDKLQTIATNKELKFNNDFNLMELQSLRRKKLENSIDELKGFIRTFAYIDSSASASTSASSSVPSPSHWKIDYHDNLVHNDLENISYPFTRLILPHNMATTNINDNNNDNCIEKTFIQNEFQIFIDMCLNQLENFNLFSISINPWTRLRDNVLYHYHSLINNKNNINKNATSENMFIKFQCAYLSDTLPSIDYLTISNTTTASPTTRTNEPGINLRFEQNENNEKLIEIDSKIISLNSKKIEFIDTLLLNLKLNDTKLVHGLNIFKFTIKKTGSINPPPNNNNNTNILEKSFYFIETNNSQMLKNFHNHTKEKISYKASIYFSNNCLHGINHSAFLN